MIHDFENTPMHMRPIPNPTPLPPKKDKETKQTYNERWNPTFKELFEKIEKEENFVGFLYSFLKVKEQSKRHQSSHI